MMQPNPVLPILRPHQQDTLDALKKHAHVFLIAPTGSGKTLIFQIHARRYRKVVVVIPLVALARQVKSILETNHFDVIDGFGTTARSPVEQESGVWIVSPEVLSNRFEAVRRWGPEFVFIDEAHCVWDWSEDFRPDFMAVFRLFDLCSIQSSYWATATIPVLGLEFIQNNLRERSLHIIGRFSVPSQIDLRVTQVSLPQRISNIRQQLSPEFEGTSVIFVSTRQLAERTYQLLRPEHPSISFYHAGMSPEERQIIESNFRDRRTQVMVATSAFGMGMDIAHLTWGILLQPTASLLALAQAIGRVGRSGGTAKVDAYWDPNDFSRLSWVGSRSERKGRMLADVEAWYRSKKCKPQLLGQYFNGPEEDSSPVCGRCPDCVKLSN
jgi:ATP-dependent DNA helicase RecQ